MVSAPQDQAASAAYGMTAPLQQAIAEAEELIANAPFIKTEADRLEGYEYLSGRIRMAMQTAFDYDVFQPVFMNPTHQYSKQGLDNPDAIYFNAYLEEGVEYVVRGRRGSSADLSFQVMSGSYTADSSASSLLAIDDRSLDIAADGTWELHYTAEPGANTLIVREVFNDWDNEERGTLWLERRDTMGLPRKPLTREALAKRYGVAARALTGSIKTWFAFPHFFQYKEPVNTLTVPASTPGGLASQFSSIGHYELAEDEAMIVTVPACGDCAYQGMQIGSDWYASTDYESHQTSLTKAQASVDDDGMIRFVISERPPGGTPIANWLETTGHRTGSIMLRWQRVERDLTAEDGPRVEIVPVSEAASVAGATPLSQEEYAVRIAARQRAIARRMIS